ncbi:HupE/UreJ family protein [Paenibacillus sp. GCM10027626]|uniref:HupE/UreJ family protein n=1 Tax=Paenibacillus sp. GCM10027626 TaxID=3273411 RepID=UPI003639CA5A
MLLMLKKWMAGLIIMIGVLAAAAPVSYAHDGDSVAYTEIQMKEGVLRFHFRIDMYDMMMSATPNDPDLDYSTSEGLDRFITKFRAEVEAVLLARIKLYADGLLLAGRLKQLDYTVMEDQPYGEAVLEYPVGSVPEQLAMRYDLVFDDDAWHANFVTVTLHGKTNSTVFLNDNREFQTGTLTKQQAIIQFFGHGVRQWVAEYSHLLLLLGLLLGVRTVKQAAIAAAAVVAACLAAVLLTGLNLAALSVNFASTAAWLSAVVIGLLYLFKDKCKLSLWWFCACGVIHSISFAGLVSGIRLEDGRLLYSLLTYIAGIATGLLLLVLLLFPLLYYGRKIKWFAPALAAAVVLSGLIGLVQRMLA